MRSEIICIFCPPNADWLGQTETRLTFLLFQEYEWPEKSVKEECRGGQRAAVTGGQFVMADQRLSVGLALMHVQLPRSSPIMLCCLPVPCSARMRGPVKYVPAFHEADDTAV